MASDTLTGRTEEFLDGLLQSAAAPPANGADEGQVWTIRDKLALAATITNFMTFRVKQGDGPATRSPFGELKDALGSGSARN